MATLHNIDFVVLCGGLGKRLRSVIGSSQKVMAKFNGEPFLNVNLKHIFKHGGRRVILCTGYKSESIEKYYRKNNFGLDIIFSHEKTPLGTGGAVKNIKKLVFSDPFFVLNGDSFCPIDYHQVMKLHNTEKAMATLVVRRVKKSDDYGVIKLNKDKEIISFQEKFAQIHPPVYVNAGVYCFEQNIFDWMPEQKRFSIEYDFFPTLVGRRFFGFEIKQNFTDIGNPERYTQAQKILKKVRK